MNKKRIAATLGLLAFGFIERLRIAEANSESLLNDNLDFPVRLAHYYPWYPEHWADGTNYLPSLDFYDSSDQNVIDAHLLWGTYAHLDGFISSWWGAGKPEDQRLALLLNRTQETGAPLKWAIMYEWEGYSDPSWWTILQDLLYLEKHFSHPAYLRVNGEPVIFVYHGGQGNSGNMTRRWWWATRFYGKPLHYVLQSYTDFPSNRYQPDSWHSYNPTQPIDGAMPWFVSISPGFWKYGSEPSLERDPTIFEQNATLMVQSEAWWQIVTTFNEWGEGTQIEATQDFSPNMLYLNILCRILPGEDWCE